MAVSNGSQDACSKCHVHGVVRCLQASARTAENLAFCWYLFVPFTSIYTMRERIYFVIPDNSQQRKKKVLSANVVPTFIRPYPFLLIVSCPIRLRMKFRHLVFIQDFLPFALELDPLPVTAPITSDKAVWRVYVRSAVIHVCTNHNKAFSANALAQRVSSTGIVRDPARHFLTPSCTGP